MADHATQTTTDHETIRKWAEARCAEPAIVAGTDAAGQGPGILRLNLPGYAQEGLAPISWDDFFRVFEDHQLAFLYQAETVNGEESNFFKFISREASS